ncbi:MAG: putative transposase [Myxococcota bacterium]|jgi:putative transposase
MWGTDATSVLTGEGTATVFLLVDHCTSECLGVHAALRGTRFEALEPVRQAVRHSYGGYGSAVAVGTALRHDHGSQYMSRDFQAELWFLGVRSSPAFVAEPECNGVAERFVRTLKEQLQETGGPTMPRAVRPQLRSRAAGRATQHPPLYIS